MTGFVETTDRSPAEKNRLLPPNPYSDTPFDFLRAVLMGMNTQAQWGEAPDVQAWLDGSRLNVVKGVESTEDGPRLPDLQVRFVTAVFPAWRSSVSSRAAATPSEQELMFDPAGDGEGRRG